MTRRVHLVHSANEGFAQGIFYDEIARRKLSRLKSEYWPTRAKLDAPNALWHGAEVHGTAAVLELVDGAIACVGINYGNAMVQVAGESQQVVEAGLEEVRSLLPRAERDREGRVPVTFWSYTPHGPMPMGRTLNVPSWGEIEDNYEEGARASLARLMSGELPWRGGQLILWHGETGTGKTTALRALAREWSSWCEPHYITDPEKFFGEQSDYMLSVMLQYGEDLGYEDDEDGGGEDGEGSFSGTPGPMIMSTTSRMWAFPPDIAMMAQGGRPSGPAWRLLILEDTGELLAADARVRAGQGLSRFLNVVDGLIGQGLRILVLVTTNEELGRLHPAIARPGRCAANVLFRPLPVEQSNAWLEEKGREERVSEPTSLAGLYAIVEGWEVVNRREEVGFG
jgi:Domain of unknown function (DUF5925)/ATPase family associated with various cellular activities (AAA)